MPKRAIPSCSRDVQSCVAAVQMLPDIAAVRRAEAPCHTTSREVSWHLLAYG